MPNNIHSVLARVTQITVQAQNKSWESSNKESGHSGETVVTWTLVPPEGSDGWTPPEAQITTMLARKELQRILIADAAARQVRDPDVGTDSLPGYDKAMEILRTGVVPEPTQEN